jgi:eukaryotic-like serine/threonine-protein kinase
MVADKFKIIKLVNRGGMGEIFLAEDLACQRMVALKRIRENLRKFPSIRIRFLREAKIAARLTHPSIIPILSICEDEELAYYTMPYVEGRTLKAILKEALLPGQKWSIPALVRVFMNICQAVAYCHSKKIIHRDLKPENVIIGKFGEVLVLDWGLAVYMSCQEEVVKEKELLGKRGKEDITRLGKVVGTLAYLAPERARGEPSTEQTDLYALGVIFYQILTLQLPFKRITIEKFQKNWAFEESLEPIEVAPYRDIPQALNRIAKKAIAPSLQSRYQKVSDFIRDLESFIEGKSEWIVAKELFIEKKEDWEFQENVLLAKHIAITRFTQVMEWVNLMISKDSFSGNIKLETQVYLKHTSFGIGFLLNVPKSYERTDLMEGFCVWIGSEHHPGCKVFRCNIEVFKVGHVFLNHGVWHNIHIEKTENHLYLYIDGALRLHYVSQMLLAGDHIGLLFKDADLEIFPLRIFWGSQNLMVSCLAVPDAFLVNKNYSKALLEYRRIASLFPGCTEGREALFRSGITILEKALSETSIDAKFALFEKALEEFGRLSGTAGAPLEYLGKSVVYKEMGEFEEEANCIELAVRKYRDHPLFSRMVDHIVFRLHEACSYNRMSAYYFVLIALRHLPQIFSNLDHDELLKNLYANLEIIPFFHQNAREVQLAFFLARVNTLLEIIELETSAEDAFYALLALGFIKEVEASPHIVKFPDIQSALSFHQKLSLSSFDPSKISHNLREYLFQSALSEGLIEDLLLFAEHDVNKLWALLFIRKWEEAASIFAKYSLEQLCLESSPFFSLFGCFLWATKGENVATAHFIKIIETPHPKASSLLGHFLLKKINFESGWINAAFLWEKMELLRQLTLFNHCCNNMDMAKFYLEKLKKLKNRSM